MKPQAVKRSNLPLGLGLVLFGTGMALFPLWYTKNAAPQVNQRQMMAQSRGWDRCRPNLTTPRLAARPAASLVIVTASGHVGSCH